MFWLVYEPIVGDRDFFATSHPENDCDPSRNFFAEHTAEEKDSVQFKSHSQSGKNHRQSKLDNSKENLLYKAYLIRFINILLSSTGFSDDSFEHHDSKSLKVELTLSRKDFDILKKIGSDEDISLETFEDSFRSMFTSKHNFYTITPVVMEYLKYAVLVALLLAILTYIVVMTRKIGFKIPGIRFILFIAYIAVVLHSLLKEYEDLSESIILKRMEFENIGSPPKECMYSKMTYLERIYVHIFKDDTCQRFLQSRKSVWYEMDLVSIFLKPFQTLFSSLCFMLGEGSEKMLKPFIDRSPWPVNVILELIVTIMQLPLLFFFILLTFFALTSRNFSLRIPWILSLASEKNHDINFSNKNSKEEKKEGEGSIKTYVVNHGGIVLLGNEEKQFQNYSIQQGSSSLNVNSQLQLQSFQNNDSFMNIGGAGYSKDIKSSSIFDKPVAIKKKDVRKEQKKLTYFKKMNFKPSKRNLALKVAKDIKSIEDCLYLES